MLSPRPTSERRAAAARANGAKSRGPVTAQGKTNSSANSRRHGLRSENPFIDPDSTRQFADRLASYENELNPDSPIEHRLVTIMALADTRLDYIRRLETQTWNREIARLKLLAPDATPGALIADAFRYLVDNTCFLDICGRLETRFDNQFEDALKTLRQQQAWRRASAPNRNSAKVNVNERTQQAAENTEPHYDRARQDAAPARTIAAKASNRRDLR